ncbi:hypothetical protein MN116_001419 [Schistosoma mekongi]|uniref:AN1-type zinc finger protein 4 n=1 Tax=Schistosoma mekongi TaxID=38744 RepID=A0AAE1ZLI7_SCHME|nr:hypothetical protein MN116_001419 [Schistosoma mekongi]
MLMGIFIESLTGSSFKVRVSPTETVVSVKYKIQRAGGIPVTHQHLIWRDDELHDHCRLKDYSISEGSTLRLVLSLRGGPLNAPRTPPLRLTPIYLPKTTLSPFTSTSDSICSNNFVNSISLPPIIKPSILQSQNTEIGDHLDAVSDKSKRNSHKTDLKCFKIDELIEPLANVLPKCSTIPAFIVQKAFEVNLPNDFRNSVSINTPINSEFNEQNSNGVGTCPTNSKNVSILDGYNENITDTTHTSRRNQSLPLFGKNATNILALEPSNSVARATYSSNIISELSNSSPFSPSIYYSESSALKEKLPSVGRSYNTHDILSVTHKKGQELETSLSISDFREDRSNISKVHNEQQVNDVDNLDNFNNTETIRPTTANFLAGLLAGFVPNQTTSDYGNHSLYPYHWLSKASPLLENEEESQLKNFSFLDSEESDSFVTSNFEEDSDQGEVDAYETDDSRYYSYSLNDDDSQAGLKDYLFYYPSGSPPFVPTDYRSYSYYSIRNSSRGNHTQINGCHGTAETKISSLNTFTHNECPDWGKERDRLVEEVTKLKSKMNILRLRKQSQHKNTLNADRVMFKEEVLKDNQSNDIINWKNNSKQLTETSANSHGFPMMISQNGVNHLSNLRTSSLSSLKEASDFLKLPHTDSKIRVRQRRCATVTPPDINYLIKMTDSQDKEFQPTNLINPSLFCSERISQSSEDNIFKNPSFLTSCQLMAEHLSPNKSLTTSVPILLNSESKPYNLPVNQTALTSSNPFQTGQSTLFVNCKLINSTRNRSTSISSSSSSVPLLLDSGSSVSSDHSGTSIPSQLPTNEGSQLATAGCFSKLNNCKKKLSNPTPSYYISSILAEGSRPPSSPDSTRRKRCSMCLRKTGLANSYLCRCDRNFCSLHRYAEVHACQYDYKAEARRYMIESNAVVTTPKLPKI